jgi:hypothetical protein
VRPEDRRSFTVRLTRNGARSAARVHQHLAGLEERALDRLTERDLRGFQAVLHALSETIDGDDSTNPRRKSP